MNPIDGIESGEFLARCHRPPDCPFWRPILRSWLLLGGGVFWTLLAWRAARFVAGVFQ